MTTRRTLMHVARLAFVAACVVALVVSFRGHGAEIAAALAEVSVPGLAIALVATAVGHVATVRVWMQVIHAFGVHIPAPQSSAIYLVSQLGKYIPGSVWSIGAQAHMAAAFRAKPRVTAAAGLVTLGYFVGSGALVSSALASFGLLDTPWPRALSAVLAVAALLALTPPVVTRAAAVASGAAPSLSWAATAGTLGWCALLWTAWSIGVVAPFGDYPHLVTVIGAFGICYAVGVLIVLAPAGIGPREALLIALLAPTSSVAHAAALALVSRLVHAVVDVCAAAGTWWWARSTRQPADGQLADAAESES